VQAGVIYAVGTNSFATVSLDSPQNPEVIGQVSPGVATLLSVDASGDYAYCAGQTSGIVVMDISDPSDPSWVRNVQAASPVLHVAVSDTFLAAATGLNVTLYGLRTADTPHLLTAFGRAANRVVVDAASRKIHCAGPSGAFVLVWTVSQGNVTLSEDDDYGSIEYTHVAVGGSYVNFAQGLSFTALRASNYTLAGQYGASGQIRGLASRSSYSLIGLAAGEVQYLRQTTDTPQFVTSAQAPAAINALAQSEDGHWIVAATNSGVTVIELGGTDVEPRPELPSEFLLTAYPNPFNSTTTISLVAPHEGDVEFRVFDITGRQVMHKSLHGLASSEVQLDFGGFSAGSYLLEATTSLGMTQAIRLLYLP
jgi:hypothetical protein